MDRAVSRDLHSDTPTLVIDPEGTVQSAIVNNLPVGRNVNEVLRTLKAFQFVTSHEGEATVSAARRAVQDLINATDSHEIAFGQNMTSLTFSVSRALARTWQPGEIELAP